MRSSGWHFDEVFVKIKGERHYLERAVDHEGEVPESFMTKTSDKAAAPKFLRKTLKRHGPVQLSVTDRLRSYGAALRELGVRDRPQAGRWANNSAENFHQQFRRRSGRSYGSGGCERYRNLPLSMPPSTTISIGNLPSVADRISS